MLTPVLNASSITSWIESPKNKTLTYAMLITTCNKERHYYRVATNTLANESLALTVCKNDVEADPVLLFRDTTRTQRAPTVQSEQQTTRAAPTLTNAASL